MELVGVRGEVVGYAVGWWGVQRCKNGPVCVGYNLSYNIVNLVFVFKQVIGNY